MVKVGDNVRIARAGGVYTTYMNWLTRDDVYENVRDHLSHYQYGRKAPEDNHEWEVVFIAPHKLLSRDYADVALIDDGKECYMFSTDALEPVTTSRRMTNRELCRWLAEGNGEVVSGQGPVGTWYCYEREYADIPVQEGVKIHSWDETEWREPLREEEEEDLDW